MTAQTLLTQAQLERHAEEFLAAWNSQEVERVLDCYTEDVTYIDPNTRGAVEGRTAMGRYLTKLFEHWQMSWSLREGFPLSSEAGGAVLWQATLARKSAEADAVTVNGMDLVILEGDRIKRNEVYFDRALLAPLLGS